GTLRWTVANASSGDTIRFDPVAFAAPHNIIHLRPGLGEIHLGKDLDICGKDCDGNLVPVVIDGSHWDRIFEIDPNTTVSLCDLTLRNGYSKVPSLATTSRPGLGGAILNYGYLTTDTVTFDSNVAEINGGAIEVLAGQSSAGSGGTASLYTVNST